MDKFIVIIILVSCMASATVVEPLFPKPAIPTSCGDHIPPRAPRIMDRALFGEFPFEADITVKDLTTGWINKCSGAIVDNDKILTSAKCVRRHAQDIGKDESTIPSDLQIRILVGSVIKEAGNEVHLKRIEMDKRGNFTCGRNFHVHGLVTLVLREPMEFSLTRYGNYPNINSVCLGFHSAPRYKANMVSLPDGASEVCQNVIEIETFKCPETNGPLVCGTSSKYPIIKNYREGAPLVRYNSYKKWQLVGLYSKQIDLWRERSEGEAMAVFVQP